MKTTTILGSVLMLSILATSARLNAQISTEKIESLESAHGKINARISKELDGKDFKLSLSGDKVTGLLVDGRTVPESGWETYASQINMLITQLKKDQQRAKTEMSRSRVDQQKSLMEKDRTLKVKSQTLADQSVSDQMRIKAQKDEDLAAKDLVKADAAKVQADQGRLEAEKNRKVAERNRKLLDELITELVSDQIIGSKQDLKSLQVEPSGMRVNGNLQSEAVLQKYLNKYPSLARKGVSYNFGLFKAR